MANHSSTKKAVRQIIKRRLRNKSRYSDAKTYVKKLISETNVESANGLFKIIQSKFAKVANKGILKKNAVARKISKLHKKIKKL